MKRFVNGAPLMLLAVALSQGCAEQRSVWIKPGASDQEFMSGLSLCRSRARVVIHESDRAQVTRTDRDIYERCLRDLGYQEKKTK